MLEATEGFEVAEGLATVVGKVSVAGRVLPSKRIDGIVNQAYRAQILSVVGPLYVFPATPALAGRIAEH